MKKTSLLLVLAAAPLLPAVQKQPFTGRWDLTIQTPAETYPSWMEFSESEGKPQVRVVSQVSSVHPVKDLKVNGSTMTFTTNEYFGKRVDVDWEVTAAGGKLTGTQKRKGGVTGKLTGVPAPALVRKVASWGKAEPLFNGRDLAGWEPLITEPGKSEKNNWKAIAGELVNQAPGANIRTKRTFQDFKLHLEYNCPNDGNSGVYLRGRYEVQVDYGTAGNNDKLHGMGSIYGFLAPAAAIPPKPGQWESFDMTLVGRYVTVVRNGITTIDNQEIPGITGGALDSREAEPGPIYIQGDHTGGMKYRNIAITLPAR